MKPKIYSVATLPNITATLPSILCATLQTATTLQLPLAIWRLPVQTENGNCHIAVDFSGKSKWVGADLETLPAGFMVSPFVQPDGKVYFIQADFHFQSLDNQLFTSCFDTIKDNFEVKEKFADLLQTYLQQSPTDFAFPTFYSYPDSLKQTTQADYEQQVKTAVAAMEKGKFQKVVLSRNKLVSLPSQIDLAQVFLNLCEAYPTAFISLVTSPELGTWVGASPELLISIDKKRIFRTVALAATQPKGAITNLQEALWRQKEIEEQALVSRYIINCFKKIRLREFEEEGPKTVVAGNLMHLRTDFEVDMEAVNFPQLGTVMLQLLHPTSAVCGMPKPEAMDFIIKHEKHDRKLYAGYLGQVNINQETHLFVNLRCMEILKKHAFLYAGAGLTKDSIPEREWNETELKCKTVSKGLKE